VGARPTRIFERCNRVALHKIIDFKRKPHHTDVETDAVNVDDILMATTMMV